MTVVAASPALDIKNYLKTFKIQELQFCSDSNGFEATAYSQDNSIIVIPDDAAMDFYFISQAIETYISEQNDYKSIESAGSFSVNTQGTLTFTGTVTLRVTY